MEKANISLYQLFVLMFLFLHGTAMLVPLAIHAKQDAWLSILLGMTGGFVLFWIHYRLYIEVSQKTLVERMQKMVGKFFGQALSFLYILYFIYIAARILRDFGEMLLTTTYIETPLFVLNALLILVVIYAVRKGIEVLARTGEILFMFLYLLAITGFVLIVGSGLIDTNNLLPVLEGGIMPIMKVAATQTVFVPFGEAAIAFSCLFPYLKDAKKMKTAGWLAMCWSGINLAIIMAINVSVLGVDVVSRSPFPLITTVENIQVAEFLERLDVFFMFAAIIGVFFKMSIFFYGAVANTAVIFKIKNPSQLVYPLGFVVLMISQVIASSYSEHIKEGLGLVAFYINPVLHLIIPAFLLIIAFIKKVKKKKKNAVFP